MHPRIIRLIQKWLKAGILENGVVAISDTGTGQGSVASPLLSNVYLHYVFDLWAERWRRREASGDMIIVRYADDIIVRFQYETDARRFWDAMRDRLEEYSLSLNPDKTRLMSDEKPMGQAIQIDEARIRDHLGEMVRGTVAETWNAVLDAEADELCGAGRYEWTQARQDTRAGSYERTLQTSAGDVNLKIPKLRRQTFETAIIECYRRRESSVEEALIEMYLAGISVRRVEDITEALWGTRVSPSTVSNLNKKIYAKIEAWRNRRIEGEHPYLYLDGIVMKRTWAGEVRNVSLQDEHGGRSRREERP